MVEPVTDTADDLPRPREKTISRVIRILKVTFLLVFIALYSFLHFGQHEKRVLELLSSLSMQVFLCMFIGALSKYPLKSQRSTLLKCGCCCALSIVNMIWMNILVGMSLFYLHVGLLDANPPGIDAETVVFCTSLAEIAIPFLALLVVEVGLGLSVAFAEVVKTEEALQPFLAKRKTANPTVHAATTGVNGTDEKEKEE